MPPPSGTGHGDGDNNLRLYNHRDVDDYGDVDDDNHPDANELWHQPHAGCLGLEPLYGS